MPRTARRPIAALVLSMCVLATAATAALLGSGRAESVTSEQARQANRAVAPVADPVGPCPFKVAPASAVDTSEKPARGQQPPAPLPIPDPPIGGARMGECGLVLPGNAPPLPDGLGFDSWLIADLDSGTVLAGRDPHARLRPASLIKVLLGMVVIRDLKLDTVHTGSLDDADQEGTRVGIGPGGKYTVDQLLHALLMRSGNDAAHALAVQLGGVPQAVRKMNALARELGALDTRVATPSGLDGPGMSTSSYDMALLFRRAMQMPQFAAAVATRTIDFPGFGAKPGFKISNDNSLLTTYAGTLGGKTGFTDDAQHTYITSAERDNRRLVLVMLHGTNRLEGQNRNGRQLMDYAFALAAARTESVGQLVDRAPSTETFQTSPQLGDAGGGDPADEESPMHAAFGTVGLPLTALAGVGVLVMVALWLRRRRARAARAARDRERAAKAAAFQLPSPAPRPQTNGQVHPAPDVPAQDLSAPEPVADQES